MYNYFRCYKKTNKRRVNLFIIFYFYFSAINWKAKIDKFGIFLDGGKLPCVLVENKADLLDKNEINNIQKLEEFAKCNEYDGYFRTSAKTGLNVNEAMEYLIDIILKRIKYMNLRENEIINEFCKNEH